MILILFAQLLTADPSPKWLETPVPHWSCGAGHAVTNNPPVCRPVPPFEQKIEGYNANAQELIRWGQVETVPASGVLRIRYASDFVRQPGCDVIDKSDEATNRVRFSDSSKAGVTIHAKPGHKLHLNCRGIINR